MKIYIFLSFLFVGGILTCQAQSAGLTKTETIDYINKRLNSSIGSIMEKDVRTSETDDLGKMWVKITYATVKLYNSQLQLNFECTSGYSNVNANSPRYYQDEESFSYVFDVNKIDQIFISGDKIFDSSPLLYLGIGLSGNYVNCVYRSRMKIFNSDHSSNYWDSWNEKTNSQKSAFLPFQKDDFEKCKKAFLYLRDLIKAEDPFAN